MFQRLPPILRMPGQSSNTRLQSRFTGSFRLAAGTRHLHRDCNFAELRGGDSRADCYAIRAGRNLPDKEFRYLRTVIVTAAVNRGFGSELLPEGMTPCLNLPAPSTRQSTYILIGS